MKLGRKLLRCLLPPMSGKWLYIFSAELEANINRYKRTLLKECGSNTSIAPSAYIISPSEVSIGSDCMINEYVHILGHGGVRLGNGVWIANHASIISTTHPVDVEYIGDYPQIDSAVTIENNVWIGSHVVILPGITLGQSCVIGAGSVVTKNVPPYTVAAGVPARVIRSKTFTQGEKKG